MNNWIVKFDDCCSCNPTCPTLKRAFLSIHCVSLAVCQFTFIIVRGGALLFGTSLFPLHVWFVNCSCKRSLWRLSVIQVIFLRKGLNLGQLHSVKTFHLSNTLRQELVHPKGCTPHTQKSSLMYAVQCSEPYTLVKPNSHSTNTWRRTN